MCGSCLKKTPLPRSSCHPSAPSTEGDRPEQAATSWRQDPRGFALSELDRGLPACTPSTALGKEELRTHGGPPVSHTRRQTGASSWQQCEARLPTSTWST